MLGSARVMAFVATTDAGRARRFYEDLLGLRFVADDGHALVFDAGGTMLRIQPVREHAPTRYTVLGWRVDDLAGAVEALRAKGIELERYDGIGQDELGIMTFRDGTKVAWFVDPDRNILSLTQF